MSEMNALTFNRLLEMLAEKLATKLLQEPSRLFPRLLTMQQAAIYLGLTPEAMRRLTSLGKIPTLQAEGGLFIDRRDLDEWIEDNKVGWANAVGVKAQRRPHGS